ncbi:MAG: hypothetical protein ACRCWQ_00320, partial [Bacilli bacterium]
ADSIDDTKPASVFTYQSNLFKEKNVEVYSNRTWRKYYTANRKEIYAHTTVSWASKKTNTTKTKSVDYNPPQYAPVKYYNSENYANNKELTNRGWTNWKLQYNYYRTPENY